MDALVNLISYLFMSYIYMKYKYHNISINLLLLLSTFHFGVLANTQDEIKQNILQVRKLIGSDPKAIPTKVALIRKQYKKELTTANKAQLINYESFGFIQTGQYQLALDKIEEINKLDKSEINDFDGLINGTRGIIYRYMGQGDEALKFFLLAYQSVKEKPNEENKITLENNIGYTAVQLGFYQQALPFLKRVLTQRLKQNTPNTPKFLAMAYNNLGEALFHLKQVQQAQEYHQKALTIRLEHNLTFHLSYSYHNLALIYHQQKKYPQAKAYLIKAIKIRADNNHTLGTLESQFALAKVYQATQENKDFISLAADIITMAKKENHLNILADIYQVQSQYYQSAGQYKKALSTFKLYHNTLEGVKIKKTDTHLAQYLTKSSTVAKEINILQLQKENEIKQLAVSNQQKISIIIITSATVIVSTLSLFIWLIWLNRKKIQTINLHLSSTLDELKSTQKKLIESEKMSAIATLVSGMAHQINTPLGIGVTATSVINEKVIALAEAVEQGTIKRTTMTSMLNDIIDASQLTLSNLNKTASLVTQFKMVSSQLEGDTQQQFELLTLITKQSRLLSNQLKHNSYAVNVHGTKVDITSYPNALNKVLSQLISNSVEHGFSEQEIQTIDIEIKALSKTVLIIYQDNGKGIDSEQISKIFNPFYTSKMAGDHLGLGLSIVYNLVVQLMQGKITVEPSPNEGISLQIELPLQLEKTID